MIAIVDTAPLFAAISESDANHERCASIFNRRDLDFVVPALCVAEVCYLIEQRLTVAHEAAFLRSLAEIEVEAPTPDEWAKIADLVERYGNFPLGGTDASVVALAERLETDTIVTLDRRHFGTLRMRDGRPFRLLPE